MRALREARADRDGRATIGDLLPGAYRVVAYPEGTLWPDDTRLRDRLAAGDQVRVTARQSATVQVRAQPAR
jgi:membrane protein implicated in regulation of membrane protease activity